MEFYDAHPAWPWWNVWTAEAFVLFSFVVFLANMLLRHKRVILFKHQTSSPWRILGWVAAMLLILHEAVGWKLPLGISSAPALQSIFIILVNFCLSLE